MGSLKPSSKATFRNNCPFNLLFTVFWRLQHRVFVKGVKKSFVSFIVRDRKLSPPTSTAQITVHLILLGCVWGALFSIESSLWHGLLSFLYTPSSHFADLGILSCINFVRHISMFNFSAFVDLLLVWWVETWFSDLVLFLIFCFVLFCFYEFEWH